MQDETAGRDRERAPRAERPGLARIVEEERPHDEVRFRSGVVVDGLCVHVGVRILVFDAVDFRIHGIGLHKAARCVERGEADVGEIGFPVEDDPGDDRVDVARQRIGNSADDVVRPRPCLDREHAVRDTPGRRAVARWIVDDERSLVRLRERLGRDGVDGLSACVAFSVLHIDEIMSCANGQHVEDLFILAADAPARLVDVVCMIGTSVHMEPLGRPLRAKLGQHARAAGSERSLAEAIVGNRTAVGAVGGPSIDVCRYVGGTGRAHQNAGGRVCHVPGIRAGHLANRTLELGEVARKGDSAPPFLDDFALASPDTVESLRATVSSHIAAWKALDGNFSVLERVGAGDGRAVDHKGSDRTGGMARLGRAAVDHRVASPHDVDRESAESELSLVVAMVAVRTDLDANRFAVRASESDSPRDCRRGRTLERTLDDGIGSNHADID